MFEFLVSVFIISYCIIAGIGEPAEFLPIKENLNKNLDNFYDGILVPKAESSFVEESGSESDSESDSEGGSENDSENDSDVIITEENAETGRQLLILESFNTEDNVWRDCLETSTTDIRGGVDIKYNGLLFRSFDDLGFNFVLNDSPLLTFYLEILRISARGNYCLACSPGIAGCSVTDSDFVSLVNASRELFDIAFHEENSFMLGYREDRPGYRGLDDEDPAWLALQDHLLTNLRVFKPFVLRFDAEWYNKESDYCISPFLTKAKIIEVYRDYIDEDEV